MENHVNWGILGAAKFARRHMGPALHMARRGRLLALATGSPEKAAPFAQMTPGLRRYDDYAQLLADPEITAVYVPLPNHMHVDWALRAMRVGKHVLVEKPFAMRAGDFDPVMALRDETGLVAAEAYMIVHHPQWHRVRDMVRGGDIGPLVRVSGSFSYDNRGDPGNIRNMVETGGGALPDIGVYPIGAARFVSGEEPEEILSAQIRREGGVDTWSHVTARFPSFHFSGLVSMRMSPWQEMLFHGERGVLRLTAPFNPQSYGPARIEWHRPGNETLEIRFEADRQYVNQVEAFNAAVLEGVAYPCPLEFSRGTQAMIDRIWAFEAG